jgi:TetR/AcrR family transcriptional regulator, cholesterol catabolism regulator
MARTVKPAPEAVGSASVSAPGGGEEKIGDRLLVLAAALFREKGYSATTTRELAGQLGIQKASLYHHIRSKEDLLFEISVESLKQITETVSAARDNATPAGRLAAMIAAHLETALRDQDMHTTMLIELRCLSAPRQAQVRERRDAYQELLRGVIREDQAAGRLRTDIPAGYLTLSLLNLLNWTIFWYDSGGPRSASDLASMMSTIFADGTQVQDRTTPEPPDATDHVGR